MSIRACHVKCDWDKCTGYEYFVPADIKWCFHQVMWLVSARESILPTPGYGYGWPQEPSGYIDQPGKPSVKARAGFEGYSDVAVELEQRLAKITVSGIGKEHLAILDKELLQGRKFNQLSDNARDVIMYLIKQRNEAYKHWYFQRKYRSLK